MAGTGGVPTIFPTILYDDAKAAIRVLTEALGFTEEAVYEGDDGSVLHAELSCGNGRVMLGSRGRGGVFAEAMAGGGPAGVYVVVDEVDAHHARAVEHGVEILHAAGRPGLRLPRLHGAGRRGQRLELRSVRPGVLGLRPPGRRGHTPPVCTWKAARRTALARAGSGWAAARATSTWTVRGCPTALTSSRSAGTVPWTAESR